MKGQEVFEFVCDRIIPGCTDVERGDTHEKVLEQAMDHLRERHGTEYIDEQWEERVQGAGIITRP